MNIPVVPVQPGPLTRREFCAYACQAASLLAKNSNPTRDEVVAAMDGNLCRCMTYSRIQKAILRAAADMRTASNAGDRRPT